MKNGNRLGPVMLGAMPVFGFILGFVMGVNAAAVKVKSSTIKLHLECTLDDGCTVTNAEKINE